MIASANLSAYAINSLALGKFSQVSKYQAIISFILRLHCLCLAAAISRVEPSTLQVGFVKSRARWLVPRDNDDNSH